MMTLDFKAAVTTNHHGIAIGYHVDCDTAVCRDCVPAGFQDGDYSEWPGFESWESPSAIFMNSESDSVTHCARCGAVIRHDLTSEGYESIADALGRYLDGDGGNAIAQWMDAYGDEPDMLGRPGDYVSEFTQGYAQAMLWANTYVNDGDPADPAWWLDGSDSEWAVSAFDEQSQEAIREDCADFVRAQWSDLGQLTESYGQRPDGTYSVPSCAGHDFALTRNHHGAGFLDRGLGELGTRLTTASNAYGESSGWCHAQGDPESDNLAHLD